MTGSPLRLVLFCHSLRSCWNHGNAHFLRGIVRELTARGHAVEVLEPEGGWSAAQLAADHGPAALDAWRDAYPGLRSTLYDPATLDFATLDLERATDGADVVLVHEWTEPALVRRLGGMTGRRFTLLWHDTHHRLVSEPGRFDLAMIEGFDGVLAFGEALRQRYAALGWGDRAMTWHEAADTALFRPPEDDGERRPGLVWIGNWGDGERSEELVEHLLRPVREVGLPATVYGVRYPPEALAALKSHGLAWRGWLPNHLVQHAFARHAVTVHVPRRFYVDALPGIPTIRVFEALACGIPLVSAPWRDAEGLFPEGSYLVAENGAAMARQLRAVLADPDLRADLAATGLAAIRTRHTCAHRVDELLAFLRGFQPPSDSRREGAAACA